MKRVLYIRLLIAGTIVAGCAREEQKKTSLTGPQAWALGASALLTERNYERHDLLGGRERTGENMKMWRKGLVEGWGIKDREDLIETLRSLDEEGDRKEFEEMGGRVASLSKRKYKKLLKKSGDETEVYHRLQLVRDNYEKLGEKSLVGWDYCRYISLCRWGYLARYFTEEEAWARIMPAARKIQETFDSWEDLGRNYLVGREFWSYEDTLENGRLYREAYRRLLDNPASPWNIYPWDMDLEDAGTGPPGAAREGARGS